MAEPGAPPPVGIAIVSWNVADLVRRCLASLSRSTVAARVVVVDNASHDGTVDMVRREFPQVGVVANVANVGFTRGVNQGLAALGLWAPGGDAPPGLLLLNPDTEVAPDAVEHLTSALAARPRLGAVGPRLVYPDGAPQSSCRRFPTVATAWCESTPFGWHWPANPVARRYLMADRDPDRPGVVDWVTGAALLLRREALQQVGGMDEGYFMYSEELDLCRRLRRAGWQTYYEPAALVTHHEAASSDQIATERHLHFQRSRARYFAKHHGPATAAAAKLGVAAAFGVELGLETAKWAVGHRRDMRRARMAAYAAVVAEAVLGGPSRARRAPPVSAKGSSP